MIIIGCHPVDSGSVNYALRAMRMARLLDGNRPSAHMLLEPWIVQAALERLGNRHLDPAQQLVIVKATRTPHKVKWPNWWTKDVKK